MKTSDIPTRPILELLAKNPDKWHHWWEPLESGQTVFPAFPPETPRKLLLSKMANLINRGWVTGCTCGCRGDFEITKLGLAELSATSLTPRR